MQNLKKKWLVGFKNDIINLVNFTQTSALWWASYVKVHNASGKNFPRSYMWWYLGVMHSFGKKLIGPLKIIYKNMWISWKQANFQQIMFLFPIFTLLLEATYLIYYMNLKERELWTEISCRKRNKAEDYSFRSLFDITWRLVYYSIVLCQYIFFLMKGTTAETGMEVTTAIKLHCGLTVFIDNGDSFITI